MTEQLSTEISDDFSFPPLSGATLYPTHLPHSQEISQNASAHDSDHRVILEDAFSAETKHTSYASLNREIRKLYLKEKRDRETR